MKEGRKEKRREGRKGGRKERRKEGRPLKPTFFTSINYDVY